MFNVEEHYYLAQISLSNHIENQTALVSNVVLVSPQAISHEIQQAYVRNHIIECLNKSIGHPIVTADLQVADNSVRYIKSGDRRSDDMIPFVEFKITSIPRIEYLANKQDPNLTRTQVDLDFILNMTAGKFVDGTVRVTAMLKPSFQIFKDGFIVDRIFSKHTINGSVSSIVMGSGIKKIGLDAFAKLQSKIGLLANDLPAPTETNSNQIIWSADDMMEELHGESARCFAV
jgi:hypothetical protein